MTKHDKKSRMGGGSKSRTAKKATYSPPRVSSTYGGFSKNFPYSLKEKKMVLILWKDAVSIAESGWKKISDVKTMQAAKSFQLGWIVDETPDKITLCAAIAPGETPDEEDDVDGDLTVEKTWIKEIYELKPRRINAKDVFKVKSLQKR
tara:strand:- start:180 stop:623 length:444 start_codon:yes stop_codon:yes gene_type:complete